MVEDTQDAARRLREQDADPYADCPGFLFPYPDAYKFASAHRIPDTYTVTIPDGYSYTVVRSANSRGIVHRWWLFEQH